MALQNAAGELIDRLETLESTPAPAHVRPASASPSLRPAASTLASEPSVN
jgi:hypothetical protein